MSETDPPRWIDVTPVDGLPEFEPCCADLGRCRDCGRIDHLAQLLPRRRPLLLLLPRRRPSLLRPLGGGPVMARLARLALPR